MRILIAEDDRISRTLLATTLERLGHDLVVTETGTQAWERLQRPDAPRLAVLDWMMPEMDGIEVCRHLRQQVGRSYVYIILLTARGQKEDIVQGLEAGADDYLTKPFNPNELRSRINCGERILQLESALESKVEELQDALAHVKRLQGLLPICMFCKKIRDDKNTWHKLEAYLCEHSDANFSHSLCEACRLEHYPG